MSNKKIKTFAVKLNWVGWFEVMVAFLGIIGSSILFRYMWIDMGQTGEKGIEVLICMSIPILTMILCLWLVMHPLFDRIIVNDNQLLIKQAFKKNKTIDVAEVITYSNTEHIQKGHRYSTISIVYGEKESIDIRSDIYKNYDLLLYYLKKHVSKRG